MPFWGVGAPDLGIALLKSFLEGRGVSCATVDVNAHAYAYKGKKYGEYWDLKNGYNFCMERDAMLEYYRDNRPLMLHYMHEIANFNPVVVGCSVKVTCRVVTELFLEDFRNLYPGHKHVLGGPEVAHFMKNSDELLSRDYIDAVCQDEGEHALLEYVKAVKEGAGRPVKGLLYKHNSAVVESAPSQYIDKLDTLPFPDFDDCFLNHYENRYALPTYTTRGCVNKCNYCSAIGFMTNGEYPFRVRSAKRSFDEIVHLKKKHPQVKEFRNCDNISNSRIRTLDEFCDLMIDSGLNNSITWNLENAVIRKEMRKPLYDKLKKSGCTLLGYGMETPSTRLLEEVGKTLAVQKDVDLPAILKEGKDAGLTVSVNVMFGLPTETEDDFDQLIEFLAENKKSFSMVNPSLNFCEYYPGSAGHDKPEEHGIDLSKGTLFWDSLDGNSTYLKRMDRFERFCELAKKSNIDNLFDVQELPNKHKLLFEYYFVCKDFDNALGEYKQMRPEDVTEEITIKHRAITTNDFSILKELNWRDKLNLAQYVDAEKTFRGAFLGQSLSTLIHDSIENNRLKLDEHLHLWKRLLRKTGIAISAGNLEKWIDEILLVLSDIDSEIVESHSLHKVQLEQINRHIERLEALSVSISRVVDRPLSSAYFTLWGLHYYHQNMRDITTYLVRSLRMATPTRVADRSNEERLRGEFDGVRDNVYRHSPSNTYTFLMKRSLLERWHPAELMKLPIRLLAHKQFDKQIISVFTFVELIQKKLRLLALGESPRRQKLPRGREDRDTLAARPPQTESPQPLEQGVSPGPQEARVTENSVVR